MLVVRGRRGQWAYALAEIHSKVEELSEGNECYSKKYLKEKLINH